MAPDTHNSAQRRWTLAIVLAIHIAVCWLLLKTARPIKIWSASSILELIYLAPASTEGSRRTSAPARYLRLPPRHGAALSPSLPPLPPIQPSTAVPGEESNAIHPSIDWADELTRAAREVAARASAPQPREFGAPHVAAAPPPKPPEFGWARSRAHRIETGPGVTAIRLGDHCVITFTPLPFPVCNLGETEANGDLFKHLHDPPPPGDQR